MCLKFNVFLGTQNKIVTARGTNAWGEGSIILTIQGRMQAGDYMTITWVTREIIAGSRATFSPSGSHCGPPSLRFTGLNLCGTSGYSQKTPE